MEQPISTSIKFLSFSLLLISIIGMALSIQEIDQVVKQQQQRETNLVLYLQDVATGPGGATTLNPKSYDILEGIFLVDDPVHVSPNASSVQVGRAQGYIFVAVGSQQDRPNVNIVLAIVFSRTEFIQIQGSYGQRKSYSELPVVNGDGKFHHATGYVVFETVSHDVLTGTAFIRLNITLTIP